MLSVKTIGSIALVGALLVTAACADSSKSMNPTAPSAVAAASLNVEATDATAESGTTAGKGNPGKPDDKGKPDDRGKAPSVTTPPSNTTPGAPTAPTNPVTGRVQIEGPISAIAGSSITVNGHTVNVPEDAVIRHGSRAVAYSELAVGDRVHVKARMQTTGLEATEVKLQNPGGGDDDDGDGDRSGTVWVSIVDATASETGADTATFRLTRAASDTLLLTAPLTVTFTLTGTATNGADYTTLPLTATFLAGQATVDVTVTPVADTLAEGSESVILTLTAVAPYVPGTPTTATVTIIDGS